MIGRIFRNWYLVPGTNIGQRNTKHSTEATRATTNPPLVYLHHCSLPLLLFLLLFHMCEFCSFGPNNNTIDRDSTHIDFAGFFSVDAINAAVAQAQAAAHRPGDDPQQQDDESKDDDSDGT